MKVDSIVGKETFKKFDKLHIRDLKARKTKADEARAQLQARKENKP